MYVGVSLLLLAVGAILTWAVEFDVAGIAIGTVGIILMVVGALGIVASLVVGRRPLRHELAVGDRHRMR